MKNRIQLAALISIIGVIGYNHAIALPIGTAFTYQGQLTTGTQPANGYYDFQFTLFDAAASGNMVAEPISNAAVVVSNGLFAVALDFGAAAFDATARWLELAVRTNGGGSFSDLAPRQQLPPAPYALHAASISSSALAGVYSNAVSFLNPASRFAGEGSALANVNAVTLGGLSTSAFWQLGGNGGTMSGLHFLGTSDNQPLEFKVAGERATGSANNVGRWVAQVRTVEVSH